MILYQEFAAAPGLDRWIECFWTWEAHEASPAWCVPPDGSLDILYSSSSGLQVVGAMTATHSFQIPAGTRTVAARFRPGMAGCFLRGTAPGSLTDLTVPLTDLWGKAAGELEARLAQGPDARLLMHALTQPEQALGAVLRAIEWIARCRGNVNLDWIASQANLSPRQFRRRCMEESGLTPKQLCRILRFRHAKTLAAATSKPDWADIAATTGYYDQPHLLRDFRDFTRPINNSKPM